MAKCFQKAHGKMFLSCGNSRLRVALISHVTCPHCPGRVIKILHVQEVVKENPANPIVPGSILAISFPEEKANAAEYSWSSGEQFQVKVDTRKQP